jgi:hypothetical protein
MFGSFLCRLCADRGAKSLICGGCAGDVWEVYIKNYFEIQYDKKQVSFQRKLESRCLVPRQGKERKGDNHQPSPLRRQGPMSLISQMASEKATDMDACLRRHDGRMFGGGDRSRPLPDAV